MNTLLGAKIYINPSLDDVAKMTLSDTVREIVTPQFAAEMDQWMREFFGTHNLVMSGAGKLFMGPKTFAALKRQGDAA